MFASFAWKRLLLPLIALAGLGAQHPRQAAKFTGKSIPDPPCQKDPWEPPGTKLPRFLVTATSALFEQGVADPRGCEYREVEIVEGRTFKTRAFVLPERPGDAGRFAVSWDGVVDPVSSVGPAADLDADVRALAHAIRRARENEAAGKARGREWPAGFLEPYWRVGWSGGEGPAGTEVPSALKLCILLRLGRADLAEELFAAGTTWTPELRGRALTDYHISYSTLARQWAATMFVRLVDAHERADDAIAQDSARRLSAFRMAAEARARELKLEREQGYLVSDPPAYFPFLSQLPELLADQERRAKGSARGQIQPRGSDPVARVAALIRDLDELAFQGATDLGNSPDGSPLVQALVAEGDAAVEPLLAAIETDTRMTRTVTYGRGPSIYHKVHPALEPEFAALTIIFKTQQFSGQQYQVESGKLSRKDLARSMRDFWIKSRAVPLTERWYRMLQDDSGGHRVWLEAAASVIQPTDQVGPAVSGTYVWALEPSAAPMKGEELRSRRDPSVSEVLARRVLQIARAPQERTIYVNDLGQACRLALLLDRWDRKAALPVIRALMTQTREAVDRGRSEGHVGIYILVEYVARFALMRAWAGEPAALAEYAAEIRQTDPDKDQAYIRFDAFEPMWTYPDDPAVREAARWLFNDLGSPWAAFLRKPGRRTRQSYLGRRLYASPLLRSAGFRDAVLDAMAIKSELGTVRRSQRTVVQYELKDGVGRWTSRGGFAASEADLEGVEQGVDQSFRACDYIAWQISAIEGAPRCELYWTKERRDEAIEECVAFLKTYGDRFTAKAPSGEHVPPHEKRAHLAFPILDRPATKEDVRPARAIFSLEGEGEVRKIELPSLPIKAKLIPPDKAPGDSAEDGWVWQAEEVRKGARWERYYGFVGRHVIARVPGGSIELAGGRRPDLGDR